MTVLRLKANCIGLLVRKFSSAKCGSRRAPWRVLFLGTDDYALAHLKALNKNRLGEGSAVSHLEATVTTRKCPVYRYAQQNKIKSNVWPMSDIKDCYDVGVIVSFGKLIPESFIEMFPRGILNVHPSLLPKWRGAAPIQHTVLNGDKETAVSIMQISPHKFDIGPLLAQSHYSVPERATALSLQTELAESGSKLLLHCLENLDTIPIVEQDSTIEPGPYAKKFSVKHTYINWDVQGVNDIDRHYRALSNMLDIRSVYNEIHVRLRCMVEPSVFPESAIMEVLVKEPRPGQPVYLPKEEILSIKCRDGWVGFREINIKKAMTAKSFYNGYLSKRHNDNLLFQSVSNGLESYFAVER